MQIYTSLIISLFPGFQQMTLESRPELKINPGSCWHHETDEIPLECP